MDYLVGIVSKESDAFLLENGIYAAFDKSNVECEVVFFDYKENIKEKIAASAKYLQILFIDLDYEYLKAIELGKYIRNVLNNMTMHIVLISSRARNDFSLFHIHAYDCLAKPYEQKKLSKIIFDLLSIDIYNERYFMYKNDGKMCKIPCNKILYIESKGRYLSIHDNEGKENLFVGKIFEQVDRLPEYFIRISKSCIVNIKYISSFTGDKAIIGKNLILNIGRIYKEDFMEVISNALE